MAYFSICRVSSASIPATAFLEAYAEQFEVKPEPKKAKKPARKYKPRAKKVSV